MKNLFYLLLISMIAIGISSCGDDEPVAPDFAAPTLTAPAVASVNVNTSVNISFTYTAEAGFATATAAATGGNANITTNGTEGDESGTITLSFTAGNTVGAGSVLVTLTDAEGETVTATAVLNIVSAGAPVVNAPAPASVELGELLNLEFTYNAAAGFASSSVAVTGGTAVVTTDGTAGATQGTITVTFTPTAEGPATVVLTMTDGEGTTDDATAAITVTDTPAPVKSVRGEITGTVNWSNDTIYQLDTRVTVVSGATLNIEGGTVIKGAAGQGANSTALLVARGGTLNANGTATAPIIFTSVNDQLTPEMVATGNFQSPNLSPTQAGLWGGVIILGDAPISVNNEDDNQGIPNTESQIEGIPVTDENGRYGGSDEDDDSGTITYISIRHGGTNIGAGNEINGLTLGGVGSGTTIQWVEVVANADDGIEWFGGTVDVSGVLVWNSNDDALDTDQDWVGTCENFIVVAPTGGSAFELDGPEGASASGNVHTFNNGIVYAGPAIDHLVDFDGSTNAEITNVYFFGWDEDYGFIQDEDPDKEGDQNFNPIESFGGNNVGTSGNWQYTLATGANAAPASEIFDGVPGTAITEVAANANTVGPANIAGFSWTWAAQSSVGLSAIGIQ